MSMINPGPLAAAICIGSLLQRDLTSTALQQEVTQLAAAQAPWVAHVNQRDYQGDWNVLSLRCRKEHQQAHPILQGFALSGDGDWADLPIMERAPEVMRVLRQIFCPLNSVRLMRLAPGATIKPHRDHGLALEYGEARLHLPIQTDPQVAFEVAGRPMLMREGELWYLNADVEHSVVNSSRHDRIHLVIDCVVNNWLMHAVAAGKRQFDVRN